MARSEHELDHPHPLRNPRPMPVAIPFESDIEAWLTELEVYTPFDADRRRELEYWRGKSAAEHAAAMRSLLSVLPLFPEQYRAKPPLARCFPRRGAAGGAGAS
jgi:hypothetical protein